MPSRNEELPLAVELERAKEQLRVWDGLAIALRDPREVLDLVLGSQDVDAARALLRQRFGLDELQSNAVLDMQFRRATQLDRLKVDERRADIRAHVDYLMTLDAHSD